MICWNSGVKIHLATQPVDFRKSVNGLSMLVCEVMERNPGNGDVYVFYNRGRNRLKVLYYDGNGFMLWYKRLECGRFAISKTLAGNAYELDEQQLKWLLSGLDFMVLRTLPHYYTDYG